MNPYYVLPNFASSLRQAHTGQPARPGRQIDGQIGGQIDGQIGGMQSIGALRLVNGLEAALRRSLATVTRWHQRRTAIRQLQALSDRNLKDIGLHRSQITSKVEASIGADSPPA